MLVAAAGALMAGAGVGQLAGVLIVAVFTVLFSVVGDLFESCSSGMSAPRIRAT
jgi:hypothetical protein